MVRTGTVSTSSATVCRSRPRCKNVIHLDDLLTDVLLYLTSMSASCTPPPDERHLVLRHSGLRERVLHIPVVRPRQPPLGALEWLRHLTSVDVVGCPPGCCREVPWVELDPQTRISRVASRANFVGRRRVIQRCLRTLKQPIGTAGAAEALVLQGMGGLRPLAGPVASGPWLGEHNEEGMVRHECKV